MIQSLSFGLIVVCALLTLSLPTSAQDHLPRGYSIPVVDLSDQVQRQVVVDREQGQYLGHVTTTLLPDGHTVLAVYPKGHGRGEIVYKRSRDGGKHWSERLPTPASWRTSLEVPTIYQTVDHAGKRRLIMFSGLYPIREAVSEDLGRHWSELKPIGDFGGIVAMSCLTMLKNGNYVAMFHDDGRYFSRSAAKDATTFTLYQTISADGGLTWGKPTAIFSSPAIHLCEPGIVRSPDGAKLAVLLRENSRTRNSYVIFSGDEANSWSAPRELPAALTGDRHAACFTPDGRLVITFRDTTHVSATKGDWVCWVGRFEDIELGTEGDYRVRLMKNYHAWDCAYSGLEVLKDGTLVATTYGHWQQNEQPFIVCVRFTLQDTDRMVKR